MMRLALAVLLILTWALPVRAQEPSATQPYRNPAGVAFRSALLPGWGQSVNGQGGKASAFAALAGLGLLLGSNTIGVASSERRIEMERGIGWATYAFAVVGSAMDSYATADRQNRQNGYYIEAQLSHVPREQPIVRIALLELAF
jgi:hypothetical protein